MYGYVRYKASNMKKIKPAVKQKSNISRWKQCSLQRPGSLKMAWAVVLCLLLTMGSSIGEEIKSPRVTDWGDWGSFEYCPNGVPAQAMQLQTEHPGPGDDDTALNSIRFFCGDPKNSSTKSITSLKGTRGTWGAVFSCYPFNITGFELKSRKPHWIKGEVAATNLKILCGNGNVLTGDGKDWGEWSGAQRCP